MKYEVVQYIPSGYRQTKNMQIIEEFLNMDAKTVKVIDDLGDFKSDMSMRNSLAGTIKRFNYGVVIRMCDGAVYLTK